MSLRRPAPAVSALALLLISACSSAAPAPATPIAPGAESPAPKPGNPSALPADSGSGSADRPQVEKLAGCSLLTEDEVWDAFGFTEGGQFTLSRGESCEWQVQTDDVMRGSVQIEPGGPDDFEDGASVDGLTPGQPMEGIGAAARWFAGDGTGVLTVVQDTDLGYQFFRLSVDDSELSAEVLKDSAVALAILAAPRFPGAQSQTVSFERQVPDARNASLVDNILAREASGEWTREEGLVATLQVLAKERGPGDVVPEGGLAYGSAGGVVELAREYLDTGTDAATQTEIARLLDLLVRTRTDLEEMTTSQRAALRSSNAGSASVLLLQNGEQCELFGTPGPCLDEWVSPELDAAYGVGKYRMYTLHGDLGTEVGWTDQHYFWAMDALVQSAKAFEALGTMPSNVSVTLLPWGQAAYSLVDYVPDDCQVNIYTHLQDLLEGQFKQWIAGELAHCFISATFPGHQADYATWQWWNHALAVYLSNVVYPAPRCGSRCDLEWFSLPDVLAQRELATTLFGRSSDNEAFFQYLGETIGDEEIVKLVATLPPGGDKEANRAALADYTGMKELFHDFIRGLTDANIGDSGGDTIPYEPQAWELQVSAPQHIVESPPPFGTSRIHLMVAAGQTACLEHSAQGDVRQSWRPGAPGAPGTWADELPDSLQGDGVFVATTTDDGAQITITVNDVVEEPSDCEGQNGGGSVSGGEPCFCEPSDYYELKDVLEAWFRRIVGN